MRNKYMRSNTRMNYFLDMIDELFPVGNNIPEKDLVSRIIINNTEVEISVSRGNKCDKYDMRLDSKDITDIYPTITISRNTDEKTAPGGIFSIEYHTGSNMVTSIRIGYAHDDYIAAVIGGILEDHPEVRNRRLMYIIKQFYELVEKLYDMI